jgi:tRNA dimethylallyltransferase
MDAVAILGPTASGKSRLAMLLAEKLGGEIVSIDSRQVYVGLDIGTSKPSVRDRELIPHHLVDILDPNEKNSAESHARMAKKAISGVMSRGKLPVLVGGSGLYWRALFEGLFSVELSDGDRERFARSVRGVPTEELRRRLLEVDAETGRRLHPNDRYRIVRAVEVYELTGITLSDHFGRQERGTEDSIDYLRIGLNPPRDRLRELIDSRTIDMIRGGWVEEARSLLDRGYDPSCPGLRTIGYPEVVAHVRGEIGETELVERIQRLTRQYAKRQMTWFRKERDVHWIDKGVERLFEAVLRLIDSGGAANENGSSLNQS